MVDATKQVTINQMTNGGTSEPGQRPLTNCVAESFLRKADGEQATVDRNADLTAVAFRRCSMATSASSSPVTTSRVTGEGCGSLEKKKCRKSALFQSCSDQSRHPPCSPAAASPVLGVFDKRTSFPADRATY